MNTFNSKTKLLATITIMLLFASAMLAVVPSANAIASVALYDPGTTTPISAPYHVGELVTVAGVVDNVGSTAVAYLHEILPENRLGSQRLTGSSTNFAFNVTLPEIAYGTYEILVVEELSSGGTSTATSKSASISIGPRITFDLQQDAVGERVTIYGTGYSNATAGGVRALINNFTIVRSDGSSATYNLGATAVRVNAMGSFTTSFVVPSSLTSNTDPALSAAYTVADGNYIITASEGDTPAAGKTASGTFTVGPVITLTPNSGTVGTSISISGRGFTPGAIIRDSTYTTGVASTPGAINVQSGGAIPVGGTGRFSGLQVTIVSGASTTANVTDVITVTEGGTSGTGRSASANFTITRQGTARITPTPASAHPTTVVAGTTNPGTSVTYDGSSFTKIANTEVTVWIAYVPVPVSAADFVSSVGSVRTNANGDISGSFTTPGINSGEYYLYANDTSGISASARFIVTLASVQVTPIPNTYVTGEEITIKGLGFDIGATSTFSANVTVNGKLIKSGASLTEIESGVITHRLANMEPGVYTVEIKSSTGITATTTITIKASSTLIANPSPARRESTITINGTYFTPGASVTVTFFNATTRAWVNDFVVSGANVGILGNFSQAHYLGSAFKLGDYIINATDSNGLTTEISFSVVKVNASITVGSPTYIQGDVGTFQITSNVATDGTIRVYDAINALVVPITLDIHNWVNSGNGNLVYTQITTDGVSSGALFRIASDARVGTWNWNATINDVEPQISSGTFTVLSRTATATPPASTPPASTPPASTPPASTPPATATPTPTPEEPGRDWTRVIIIIAVIALIVGVIAVFLFVTMRRKIAN